ncbi:MAG: 16S rRNA (cytosine(1402)-N(4))-methyltransferase RsmH [Mogibacterium sp.]|nr:16S rRNA (cytosine(1402)-N(4))-methyltransferase RsmH [Mogibacterium sp.]
MEFEHIPVLYDEVMEALNIKADGTYVDGTAGGGGHASGIASRLSKEGLLIAVDRDREALEAAEKRLASYECRKKLLHTNYSDTDAIMEATEGGADGILLDLGVSSYQLDNADRGFSYMNDAPLDMRMDEGDRLTAYDVVNTYDRAELTRIIREYGEENWAARIAEFIVNARAEKEIKSTGELTEIIKAAIPAKARRTGPHPAKRTFQAIRIEVNDELGHLRQAVENLPDLLKSGGRIAIITFHSLEDRIVKTEFERRLNPCTCPKELPVCVCGKVSDVKRVTKKPVIPKASETDTNPRARSAKLRVLEKL